MWHKKIRMPRGKRKSHKLKFTKKLTKNTIIIYLHGTALMTLKYYLVSLFWHHHKQCYPNILSLLHNVHLTTSKKERTQEKEREIEKISNIKFERDQKYKT